LHNVHLDKAQHEGLLTAAAKGTSHNVHSRTYCVLQNVLDIVTTEDLHCFREMTLHRSQLVKNYMLLELQKNQVLYTYSMPQHR